MKIMRKKICSIVCSAILLSSMALSTFAADKSVSKTLDTSYGKLIGEQSLDYGEAVDPTCKSYYIYAGINTTKQFNKVVVSFTMKNYYTGATEHPKWDESWTNTNEFGYQDWFCWDEKKEPRTIYGAHEIRHTKAYGVNTSLVKV